MAFIFVPNEDGGFNEGDKQTNPDTGVEYIYLEGAWRALGPKIEDQFDDLDERYVNINGDTMHGTLMFDRGRDTDPNLLISPNSGDTSTSVYTMNNGALRFRSLTGTNTNDNSTTHITIGKDGVGGGPETYLYHVVEPQESNWAANKGYVDELPDRSNNFTQKNDFRGDIEFHPPTNDSGISRVRLMRTHIDGDNIFQFTSHPSAGGSYQNSKIHVTIKNKPDEGAATIVNWIPDEPTANHQAVNKKYVDTAIADIDLGDVDLTGYLPITGGELTSPAKLEFNRGDKPYSQLHISPNGGTDYATNILAMGGGQLRFRTCPADVESTYNTHIIIDENSGNPVTKIYKLQAPTHDDDPTTRKYVEDNFVDLDSEQTITAKKTFGSANNSSTISVNLKGRMQLNGLSGNQGQILISGSGSGVNSWRNIVPTSTSTIGPGSFYESSGALYYRTN